MNAVVFLIASFISGIGDSLLVFAVPAGLGVETKDLRSVVLMWLVPAIAMFFSSFLEKSIKGRESSVRKDYAFLILAIAALEIAISCVAMKLRGTTETLILITTFVFLYALAKEGIPRLLYLVAVYRFFCTDAEYKKLAGINQGLNISASFLGALLAAFLIRYMDWRLALIFDSFTFVILGLAIFYFGKDRKVIAEQGDSPEGSKTVSDPSKWRPDPLPTIVLVVPLIFAINALVWNYLPLIADFFSVSSVVNSIILIAILRLPGLISGVYLTSIHRVISSEKIVWLIPGLFFGFTAFFIIAPSTLTLSLFILTQGFIMGVYWPTDFSFRNKLKHHDLVTFNSAVLRRLAAFQFCACLLALWIYAPGKAPEFAYIPWIIIGFIGVSYALTFHVPSQKFKFALFLFSATLALNSCTKKQQDQDHDNRVTVVLPSVSKNLDLRAELTYAATIILNDTSAHLATLSQDLSIQGQVLKSYDKTHAGKKYLIELDPGYLSFRGEGISGEDVAFSIKYLISQKKDVASPLMQIEGAEDCKNVDCNLKGVEVYSPTKILITLSKPNLRFIDSLVSPWIVLLKKGKPFLEEVGDCKIPYQTGSAHLVRCDSTGVWVEEKGKTICLTENKNADAPKESGTLVTDNPGKFVSPTLTVLAAFGNPGSSLSQEKRIQIMNVIRKNGKRVAEELHLKWSPTMSPQWMSVQPTSDLLDVKTDLPLICPIRPIRILLDTSLPSNTHLQALLQETIPCPTTYGITTADHYFEEFSKNDIGLCWFTPDFLGVYNSFAHFDCNGGVCYFNWKDKDFQSGIDALRTQNSSNTDDKSIVIDLERQILRKGYGAPIAEMNWWIRRQDKLLPIHPAGLFQIRIGDFL